MIKLYELKWQNNVKKCNHEILIRLYYGCTAIYVLLSWYLFEQYLFPNLDRFHQKLHLISTGIENKSYKNKMSFQCSMKATMDRSGLTMHAKAIALKSNPTTLLATFVWLNKYVQIICLNDILFGRIVMTKRHVK